MPPADLPDKTGKPVGTRTDPMLFHRCARGPLGGKLSRHNFKKVRVKAGATTREPMARMGHAKGTAGHLAS
ncbi:hypothetical protein GCM10023148_36640 [Actinokineospora soli]